MYYSQILECDGANGNGWRVALFVSGCTLHCKGCFNCKTWDFKYGNEFTEDTINFIINLLKPNYIQGLSILGGNPTEPENEKELIKLCKQIKQNYPTEKDIWMWTGNTIEELINRKDELIKYCDVIIDGPFIEELKDLNLQFRGSSNQRILTKKMIEEIFKKNN